MSVNVLGVQSDPRTRDMITGARNAVMGADMAAQVYCTQGSYSTAVGASGGTHAGGGALDFARFRRDGREWTWAELSELAVCLRKVGFAAWPRERIPGTWERHVHAVAINCGDASPAAKDQWADYKNRRDGLAGNAPDTLPYFDVTWESFHAAHPYVLEDVMASTSEVVRGVWDQKILNMDGSQQPAHSVLSTAERMSGQALAAAEAAKAAAERTERMMRDFVAAQTPDAPPGSADGTPPDAPDDYIAPH